MGAKCSKELLESLTNGELVPIVERVKDDLTLDIELRDDEIEIYYRGAQLFRVDNKRFIKSDNSLVKELTMPPRKVKEDNVKAWISMIPSIKDCLDRGVNKNRGKNRTLSWFKTESWVRRSCSA